jgi:putative ABC transport system permease protein
MESLRRDLALVWRQARRHSVFTVVVLLTLALGIGANTAIFSVVDGVILRDLPFEHGERLVHLGYQDVEETGEETLRFSVQEVFDLREQSDALEEVAEYHPMAFTLLGEGEPKHVSTGVVSANFFDTVGVRPLHGRLFRPADEAPEAEAGVVVSHSFWQRELGGDPGVVGNTVTLADHPMRIIGVLPPLLEFPGEDDVYITTNNCPFRSGTRAIERRQMRFLNVYARLAPNATVATAETDVGTVMHRLDRMYPETRRDAGGHGDPAAPTAIPVVPVRDELIGQFRPTLFALVGMVGLVLLIACANVANLTLARLIHREREIAVRSAIGAGRRRVVQQLITESLALAVAGGALGVLFAVGGIRLLVPFVQRFTPRAVEVGLDGRVLVFALGASLVTGLLVGLSLVVHRHGDDLVTGLRDGSKSSTGGSKHRLRSTLLVAQVAFSFVLLIGAGLTVRSLLKLYRVDPGFQGERVITGTLVLPVRYQAPERLVGFATSLIERMEAIPGVERAGINSEMPLDGHTHELPLRIEGWSGETEPSAVSHIADAGYFAAVGVPILSGREFRATDDATGEPVAIVDRAMAEHYWPDRDPLGRRFAIGASGDWMTVVGVVGNVLEYDLQASETGVGFYVPLRQQPTPAMELFVRTRSDPREMFRDVQRAVYAIDPQQPIADLRTLGDVHDQEIAPSRLTAILFGIFAALAFVLAALGIGGLVAFGINQRTQEIGIRLALGAPRPELLRQVVRKGVMLVMAGVALGVFAALALTRVLDTLLFGVTPSDPLTFVVVALLLLSVAIVACLIPARRALRIDPVTALRAE